MSNYSINREYCIVKNEMYEVIPCNIKNKPNNIVISKHSGHSFNISYKIIQSNIDAIWKSGSIQFKYKDQIILTIKDPHIQSVAEYLNKFNNISKEELNQLLEEAQNKTKTALEQEIEDLKAEKKELEDTMEIYRKIQTKKDEIKDLLLKLEGE